MKETGTTHWNPPNTGATNESGFTGLPGGWRSFDFYNLGIYGKFLSSNEYDACACNRRLNNEDSEISRHYDGKFRGFSVRCIKD